MTSSQEWRLRSKCRKLPDTQSDALFFPGKGGKKNRAESFCEGGTRCPVLEQCLNYAIKHDLEGFYAGTTREERRSMVPYMNIMVDPALPVDPPKKRKVFRKVIKTEDPYEWLDKVPGPAPEELERSA